MLIAEDVALGTAGYAAAAASLCAVTEHPYLTRVWQKVMMLAGLLQTMETTGPHTKKQSR